MSTILNEAMDAAKLGIGQATHTARLGAASTFATLVKGAGTVATIASTLRSFDVIGNGLGWLGLARRRSPIATIATFGAGFVAGTAVGVALAPMSGAELRRNLSSAFNDLTRQGMDLIQRAGSEVKGIEQKGEALAGKAKVGKAKAGAKAAERKVEDKLQNAAGTVKSAAETAREAILAPEDTPAWPNGTRIYRPEQAKVSGY